MPEPRPPIDDRIEALTMNLELLLKQGEETSKQVTELAQASQRHEREIQRFRRAMRAALESWIQEDNGE